ncbi:unnamed protein product [Bemisia tabaci]|uniref:Uncharacterized protein n=1 Tax=Bemisia tabaci TaxID=7038 RepID=A0A9P0F995_BEMTA|nr:unnamed protein product [Bemisia tabaci]
MVVVTTRQFLKTSNAGMQMFCFLALLIGSAFLLENSTVNSRIQGMIRNTVTRMILYSVENDNTERVLNAVQENASTHSVTNGNKDYIFTNCKDYNLEWTEESRVRQGANGMKGGTEKGI